MTLMRFQDYGDDPIPAGKLIARPAANAPGRPDMIYFLNNLMRKNEASAPIIHYLTASWNPGADRGRTKIDRALVGPAATLNEISDYQQGDRTLKVPDNYPLP